MSSPVKIPFSSFINLDKCLKTALYLQLSQQIINAIQRGYLPANAKLPGSRSLAELFKIHRKTVIAAYNELAAQGWISIEPNKGATILPSKQKRKHLHPSLATLNTYPQNTGFSFNQSNLLHQAITAHQCHLQITDGQPDYRLTKFSYLSSLYSAAMKRKAVANQLSQQNHFKTTFFKTQLSNYLNLSRGLHISSKNLLISNNSDTSLYILAQTLLKKDDQVVVAALGYYTANMIFQKAGAQLVALQIDEQGLVVEALAEKLKTTTIRMVYVTPQHHYPTTVSLSANRRVQLLQLAQQHGFIIVEDDFDYEFTFERQAALPLASANINGMVVYLGTFGKSLAPAFSCGFIVAPQNLINELEKYKLLLDRNGDLIMEQVLSELIEEGEMHRHIKKVNKTYQERRDYCCMLLTKYFGNDIKFTKPNEGLAIWLQWLTPINLLQLAKTCKKKGLYIPDNILYQNKNTTAMRFGFGHLNNLELNDTIEILAHSFLTLQKS